MNMSFEVMTHEPHRSKSVVGLAKTTLQHMT